MAAVSHQTNEIGVFARELSVLRRLRSKVNGVGSKVVNSEHHLCHAASAFFLSPFDRALILTMDEEGDGTSGMIAAGEGTRIRVLRKVPFPHSLAWVYTQVTELLGFTPHRDEHKTQWLSLEGKPVFKDVFLEMLRSRHSPLPHLNSEYLSLRGMSLSPKFYRQIGLQEEKKELSDDFRRNLARSLQDACEEIVGFMIEHYRRREGIQSVCLAGGLFQMRSWLQIWRSGWGSARFLSLLLREILVAPWARACSSGITQCRSHAFLPCAACTLDRLATASK